MISLELIRVCSKLGFFDSTFFLAVHWKLAPKCLELLQHSKINPLRLDENISFQLCRNSLFSMDRVMEQCIVIKIGSTVINFENGFEFFIIRPKILLLHLFHLSNSFNSLKRIVRSLWYLSEIILIWYQRCSSLLHSFLRCKRSIGVHKSTYWQNHWSFL